MTDMDIEEGGGGYGHHRRSLDGSEVSVYYSEGEEVMSCYSYFYSTNGGSYEYDGDDQSRKVSSVMSPTSSSEIDDEDDDEDATAPPDKDCRICHMGVETSGGGAIELGCSCKDDLAIAHRQCADTWFKIKGDKICEICQSVARNVGCANETIGSTMEERNTEETSPGRATALENRMQPQKVVNLVLACLVFGFFVSWIFHFHVSSSS